MSSVCPINVENRIRDAKSAQIVVQERQKSLLREIESAICGIRAPQSPSGDSLIAIQQSTSQHQLVAEFRP
jgi:hypothetical protein